MDIGPTKTRPNLIDRWCAYATFYPAVRNFQPSNHAQQDGAVAALGEGATTRGRLPWLGK
jgi:hypothetical protein